MMMAQQLAFKAAANISLGSATVPDKPPDDTSHMPNTLFALLSNKSLNCSTNSILFSFHDCLNTSKAFLEESTMRRSEAFTLDL